VAVVGVRVAFVAYHRLIEQLALASLSELAEFHIYLGFRPDVQFSDLCTGFRWQVLIVDASRES